MSDLQKRQIGQDRREIEQNRRFVFQGLQNPSENRTKSAKIGQNRTKIGVTPVRCPLLGDPENFPEEITKKKRTEFFLQLRSIVRLGTPKPYNSRHFKPPEHFQTLSELVMTFPAGLRLRVESSIAVEEAVDHRSLYGILFRAGFQGLSDTIAPLSRG